MIDRTHPLPIIRQAQIVNISRGSVYYESEPISDADLKLMRRIDELHLELPFAGARMLRDLLRAEGFEVGRKHMTTLMRRMGITALYRKPNTSKRGPGQTIWPYLLRTLSITRSNHVWAMDITYIPMARGFVYLAAVVDYIRDSFMRASTNIDASRGRQIYARSCSVCHGDRGRGGSAEELAGGSEPLTSRYPDKTIGLYWPYATTLFDVIRRSMPMFAPGSLDANAVYALTAYLLAATHEAKFALPPAARDAMLDGLAAFVEGRIERKFWSPRADLDVRKLAALEALGWRALVLWECGLKDEAFLENEIRTFLDS